jgi:hypothetical protein
MHRIKDEEIKNISTTKPVFYRDLKQVARKLDKPKTSQSAPKQS